jgi:hypothetical protein
MKTATPAANRGDREISGGRSRCTEFDLLAVRLYDTPFPTQICEVGTPIAKRRAIDGFLDEDRVRNLLTRADCIVAHNASFDCRMPTCLYPWVENLNWKCSLNGVKWETEVGMSERNLQALLAEYRIKTEEAHRARPDALGMLQLLSRRHAGKTLLAHLLGW